MVKTKHNKTSENPLQTIEVEVFDEYGEKLTKQIVKWATSYRYVELERDRNSNDIGFTPGSHWDAASLGLFEKPKLPSDPEAVESINIIDWENQLSSGYHQRRYEPTWTSTEEEDRNVWLWPRYHVWQRDEAIEDYQVPQTKTLQVAIWNLIRL